MKVKVSLVIRVLDDHTGMEIRASAEPAKVYIPGEKLPAAKGGGYYIFSNLARKRVTLYLCHPWYQGMVRELEWEEGTGIMERTFRLLPGPCYPDFYKMTIIQGFAGIGKGVYMRCMTPKVDFKLWRDYEAADGSSIYIYYPKPVSLSGKLVYIVNRETGQGEKLEIAESDYGEKWRYRMKEPLNLSYPKSKTGLYPIYAGDTDEKGNFLFSLWQELSEGASCSFAVEEGPWQEYSILPMQINKIALGGDKEERS